MRALVCWLSVVVLLGGCAADRLARDGDVAPSRMAAAREISNPGWSIPPEREVVANGANGPRTEGLASDSGWSVPPGQTSVLDPAPTPSGTAPRGAAQSAATRSGTAPATAKASAAQPARGMRTMNTGATASGAGSSNAAAGTGAGSPLVLAPMGRPAADTPPADRATLAPTHTERVAPLVPAFPMPSQNPSLGAAAPVFFGFDSDALSAETRDGLEDSVLWLQKHPGVPVLVEGHADERGTPEYNLALGERRANRVRIYLISRGIEDNRIVTVSYGEEMPRAEGHDENAWQANRRVEFSRTEAEQVSSAATQRPIGRM